MKSPPKRSISTSHVISRCLWKLTSSTLGCSIWQEIGPGVSLMNNCSIIVHKIFSKLSSSIHVNKVRFIPGIQIGLLPKIKHWQSPTPNINKEKKRDSQNLSPKMTKAAKMLRFKQSFPTGRPQRRRAVHTTWSLEASRKSGWGKKFSKPWSGFTCKVLFTKPLAVHMVRGWQPDQTDLESRAGI